MIGIAVTFGGPAWADDIKVPADPVAKAAFEVLDKHCSRCHQVGKLTAPRAAVEELRQRTAAR